MRLTAAVRKGREQEIEKRLAALPKQPSDRLAAALKEFYVVCLANIPKGGVFAIKDLKARYLKRLDTGFDFQLKGAKSRFFPRLCYWFEKLGYIDAEGIRT